MTRIDGLTITPEALRALCERLRPEELCALNEPMLGDGACGSIGQDG